MKYTAILLTILSVLITLCSSQLFNFPGSALRATRDPRSNTGPVVFPPAPPDNGETSGVIVGASGYGFVPPANQGGHYQVF